MTTKVKIENLFFSYKDFTVLGAVNAEFEENSITAIIGASGVGKSTLLSVINRLWESIPGTIMKGEVKILFDGKLGNIYSGRTPSYLLRRRVGTVFQEPNPLPMSIIKNMTFPFKLLGEKDKNLVEEKVESALKRVRLWDDVKNRMTKSALALSGGQQQRLCIARALVLEPELILFDEPTSSLDKDSRAAVEDLLVDLKEKTTIIMISHYLDQVKRIADTVFELKEEHGIKSFRTVNNSG